MKKYIKPAIISIIVLVAVFVIISYFGWLIPRPELEYPFGTSSLAPTVEGSFLHSANAPIGMSLIAENDNFSFYFHRGTTEIALYDKHNSMFWFSNPQGRHDDPLALGAARQRLNAQFRLEYFDDRGRMMEMDNYRFSVSNDRFETDFIENGIRVTYTVTPTVIDRSMLPQMIERSRFEELILSYIEGADRAFIVATFHFTTIEGITGARRNHLLENFPMLEYYELYILNEHAAPMQIVRSYDILFNHTSYTREDMVYDNARFDIETPPEENEIFIVPLEWTLTETGLIANIPVNEIYFPPDFILWRISLLEYFGSGSVYDEGYMFIPDGSGALIYFNNNKLTSHPVFVSLYGSDFGIVGTGGPAPILERAMIPVFGIAKHERGALLGIVLDGDAHAFIRADISGRATSFNAVNPAFVIRPFEPMTIHTAEGNIVTHRYQVDYYRGNITVKYIPLNAQNASYSGMAVRYREFLVDTGVLYGRESDGFPFVVQLIGAVRDYRNIFGFRFPTYTVLTTFEQGTYIANALQDFGIESPDIILTGWFSGGLDNNIPQNASRNRRLGNNNDLYMLRQAVESDGGRFFLDASIAVVNSGFPSFNANVHATRMPFNIVNRHGMGHLTQYFLTPHLFAQVLSEYVYRLDSRYQVQNISINDFGILYTDFHNERPVGRQTSLNLTADALRNIRDDVSYITLFASNAFTFEHVDLIRGLPLTSSRFNIVDRCVPFVQIVLRGHIDFTGRPINTNGKAELDMLRAIETGSGLYFNWIYADNTVLRQMQTPRALTLFSLNYHDWVRYAVNFYARARVAADMFLGERIMYHERLAVDVYKTTFETGFVIVNYSNASFAYDDLIINSMDFIAGR